MEVSQAIYLLKLIFTAAISENIALHYFLGSCPLISMTSDLKVSFQMGLTVSFVMLVSTAVNHTVYNCLLLPFDLGNLRLLFFVLVIAAVTQFLERFLDRYSPELYASFGVFLPLIAVNCAILGVCLFSVLREYDFLSSVAYSLGSGLGWLLVICLIASIKRRINLSKVPDFLGNIGITMMVAAIVSMAFNGLTALLGKGGA